MASEQGILDYNKANGTSFTVDKFADDEFFDPNSSIQKWSAKLDQYGDELVGMIAVDGPGPLVKAAEGHNIEKGKIVIGSMLWLMTTMPIPLALSRRMRSST